MDTRLLIDQIVHQTVVLLAQLSTASGIRAPMAHVADQVFLELATEIERQGVGRKVVADMFGMALRTYQRRIQRVSESATVRDRTLWEAVLDYLATDGGRTRAAILKRFHYDGEANVGAVLNDLVSSGLVYHTGHGAGGIYGITPEADFQRLVESDDREALASLLWLNIYRMGTCSLQDLVDRLVIDEDKVIGALEELVESGRVDFDEDADTYVASTFLVPVGSEQGWEAAVFDHYQAAVKAIANKLNGEHVKSEHKDRIGGATLSFDIYDGHPMEDEVYGLLERIRGEVNEVWERVVEEGKSNPVDEDKRVRVTFYMGQNVEE